MFAHGIFRIIFPTDYSTVLFQPFKRVCNLYRYPVLENLGGLYLYTYIPKTPNPKKNKRALLASPSSFPNAYFSASITIPQIPAMQKKMRSKSKNKILRKANCVFQRLIIGGLGP